MNTLANGSAMSLSGLTGSGSVEERLQALSPFQILAAILSEEAMIQNIAKVVTRPTMDLSMVSWFLPTGTPTQLNLFSKFCDDIDAKRAQIDPQEWSRQVSDFEALCGLEQGSLNGAQDAREMFRTLLPQKENLHQVIMDKKAAAVAAARAKK
jgi:hypothetical protein